MNAILYYVCVCVVSVVAYFVKTADKSQLVCLGLLTETEKGFFFLTFFRKYGCLRIQIELTLSFHSCRLSLIVCLKIYWRNFLNFVQTITIKLCVTLFKNKRNEKKKEKKKKNKWRAHSTLPFFSPWWSFSLQANSLNRMCFHADRKLFHELKTKFTKLSHTQTVWRITIDEEIYIERNGVREWEWVW